MMRPTFAVVLAWFLSAALFGQELEESTWSGTGVTIRANKPRPLRVSLEIKKAPDPHWVWRPARGHVWNITFVMPQQRLQVGDFQLDNQMMSFSFLREEEQTACQLSRQADGTYEGECITEGSPDKMRMTLAPAKGDK